MFTILLNKALYQTTDAFVENVNLFRKQGLNTKESKTHAQDLIMMTDKKTFFDLYKQRLVHVYIVRLHENEKHHTIHALALSLVKTMTRESAFETAIKKYKYLFDVKDWLHNMEHTDTETEDEETEVDETEED